MQIIIRVPVMILTGWRELDSILFPFLHRQRSDHHNQFVFSKESPEWLHRAGIRRLNLKQCHSHPNPNTSISPRIIVMSGSVTAAYQVAVPAPQPLSGQANAGMTSMTVSPGGRLIR